jgi:hypothetical protein
MVDVDEGRDISWPIDGRVGCSSRCGDAVLNAGRSNTCSIDGLRNEDSGACGRGRIAVASAEAVVELEGRNAERLSQ